MRSTLSPAFTSSKIRLMVSFMEDVGEQMINILKEKINGSKGFYIFKYKKLMALLILECPVVRKENCIYVLALLIHF